jgi:PhzF family phenazine biosynthesis protein
MPTLPLYQVDAFSNRPFAGNPAAVCPTEGALPEALMQDIAAENNLAETAFFHRQGDAFSLRWFTPTVEVDLCGHATLASALVLMTVLEPARTEVAFRTRSGTLTVRREKIDAQDGASGITDLFVMDFPARPPVPAPALADGTAAALGLRPVEVLHVSGVTLAVLETADDVRRVAPDMAAIARTGHTVCVTAPADAKLAGVDFVSRYFAPAHGVPEDPVTGSSFCVLAPYWAARTGKPALRARQVSTRGGDVRCEARGERVLIAGQGALVLEGTLRY